MTYKSCFQLEEILENPEARKWKLHNFNGLTIFETNHIDFKYDLSKFRLIKNMLKWKIHLKQISFLFCSFLFSIWFPPKKEKITRKNEKKAFKEKSLNYSSFVFFCFSVY